MLGKMKLRNRILLGYAPPVLLLIIMALSVFAVFRDVAKNTELAIRSKKIAYQLKDIELNISQIQRSLRGYLLVQDDSYIKTLEDGENDFKEISKSLKGLIVDADIRKTFDQIIKSGDQMISDARDMIALAGQGKLPEAVSQYKITESVRTIAHFSAFFKEAQAREAQIVLSAQETQKHSLQFGLLVVIIGAPVVSALAILIGLGVASRISRFLAETVSSVSSTSTEIASTMEEHERTANEQASAVNETVATVEELNAASKQNVEQADSVSGMAKQSQVTTEEGAKMAEQSYGAMKGLKDKVSAIGEQILRLSEQTAQIGTIATMVADISGQINMLALNAAVEAVRAGEQGKGFTVIAQEVRKLADQGKKSAEKTNAIVAEIQKATNAAVMATEEGAKTAEGVTGLVQKTGESFGVLSGIANSVFENTQQVALSSKQQSNALKQITGAMTEVNAGSKQTAAGLTQTKVAVKKLDEAMQSLKQLV